MGFIRGNRRKKSKGVEVNVNNFIISEFTNLILPFHREMDEIRGIRKSKIELQDVELDLHTKIKLEEDL